MILLRRPPHPGFRWPLITLVEFRRDPLTFLLELARQYGDIVFFRLGVSPAYLFVHPDYIQSALVTHHTHIVKGKGFERTKYIIGEGLLTSEGETHRWQRRLAQPSFHPRRIAGYGAAMSRYADAVSNRWRDGQQLDIYQEMMDITLGVVGEALFGWDVMSDSAEVKQAIAQFMVWWHQMLVPYGSLLEKIPWLPPNRRREKAREAIDRILYRIIAERRHHPSASGDLVSSLIQAKDPETGQSLSDTQVRDIAATIFIAGQETTAAAITWTLYLVSEHPEVEARLHEEVDRVLGGRVPTVEDAPRLTYTRMVLAEALRRYPPAWVLGRRVIKDFEVGGYRIPRGAGLLLSQYVTHHDPRFFPDPFRFDPERWTPEAEAARPAFSYFPFGAGPRSCIGESFAWLEGTLVIATIAQKWQLRHVPEHPVEILPSVALRPKYGMVMTVGQRRR
jgi:cytochrome P450